MELHVHRSERPTRSAEAAGAWSVSLSVGSSRRRVHDPNLPPVCCARKSTSYLSYGQKHPPQEQTIRGTKSGSGTCRFDEESLLFNVQAELPISGLSD